MGERNQKVKGESLTAKESRSATRKREAVAWVAKGNLESPATSTKCMNQPRSAIKKKNTPASNFRRGIHIKNTKLRKDIKGSGLGRKQRKASDIRVGNNIDH